MQFKEFALKAQVEGGATGMFLRVRARRNEAPGFGVARLPSAIQEMGRRQGP
jgi:hypothetical protein